MSVHKIKVRASGELDARGSELWDRACAEAGFKGEHAEEIYFTAAEILQSVAQDERDVEEETGGEYEVEYMVDYYRLVQELRDWVKTAECMRQERAVRRSG